jgi:hypothetical protein
MLVHHFHLIQVVSVEDVVQTPFFVVILDPVISTWVFALHCIMTNFFVSLFFCWMVIYCSKQVINYILSINVKVGCWPETSHGKFGSQIYKD